VARDSARSSNTGYLTVLAETLARDPDIIFLID